MEEYILVETVGRVQRLTLNRPDKLNAWNRPMRNQLVAALERVETNPAIGAVVLTGAGDRAFGAGQDLSESKGFDADAAESWMGEWRQLYNQFRLSSKPIVAALNGLAAGSAFQVALLCDLRVAHEGVKMGQPEINSGIATVTGSWIMREILGLARATDLTLTGRMLEAQEAFNFGLISRLVAADRVQQEALHLAELLAEKAPIAMRLNRARFAAMTEAGFENAMSQGIRIQRESYASGEPQAMMEKFLRERAVRKS